MPQLLMLAAIGTGVYLGAKWLSRKADEITRQQKRAAAEKAQRQQASAGKPARDDIPTLVQDPETGVYKIDGRN